VYIGSVCQYVYAGAGPGYIQLYDDSTDTILAGGTYTYQSDTQVNVTGLSLNAGTARYRLIVVGADIAQTIDYLRHSHFNHDHSGKFWEQQGVFLGNRIAHYDLLHNIDEGSLWQDGFIPSKLGQARNPHPQYLHRYGYQFGWDATADTYNKDNAMLGDIVFTSTSQTFVQTSDSYGNYYGSTSGPHAYFDQSKSALAIDNYKISATEGAAAGAANDRLKWVTADFPLNALGAGTPQTFSITRPSDLTHLYDIMHIGGAAIPAAGTPGYCLGHITGGGPGTLYVTSYAFNGANLDITVAFSAATFAAGANEIYFVVYYA